VLYTKDVFTIVCEFLTGQEIASLGLILRFGTLPFVQAHLVEQKAYRESRRYKKERSKARRRRKKVKDELGAWGCQDKCTDTVEEVEAGWDDWP
jgi:hypothetical protein